MNAVGFPRDWLDPQAADVATDLDLALLLVNSLDHLAPVPDRLNDLSWLAGAFTAVGHADLADELTVADLDGLRVLRERLRAVFEADDAGTVAGLVNAMLVDAGAVPGLAPTADRAGWTLRFGVGRRGLAALQARLPAALARHVSAHGIDRLGTCVADPCRCAFVDRTRASTRRFCCTSCNDRAAARAYRQRRRSSA